MSDLTADVLQHEPRKTGGCREESLMNDVQSYTAVLLLTIVALVTWMSSPAFAALAMR